MRRRKPKIIKVPGPDQLEIQRLLEDGRTEQRVVRRGQVLLAMKNPKTIVSSWCKTHKKQLSAELNRRFAPK